MKLKDLITDKLDEPMSKFCKKSGVNRTTITLIMKEDYQPSLLTIKKICKYFNVDFHDYI